MLARSPRASGCTHDAPNSVAVTSPCMSPTATGGFHRRSPTGGCAYRMPRHTRTSPSVVPRNVPAGAAATGAAVGGAGGTLAHPPTASAPAASIANPNLLIVRSEIVTDAHPEGPRAQACIAAVEEGFRMNVGDSLAVEQVLDIGGHLGRTEGCTRQQVHHFVRIGEVER